MRICSFYRPLFLRSSMIAKIKKQPSMDWTFRSKKSKIVFPGGQQRLGLALGEQIGQGQSRRHWISRQHFTEQTIMQRLIEHQARVELRVEHAHHLVPAAGKLQRLVEIGFAFFGFSSERS